MHAGDRGTKRKRRANVRRPPASPPAGPPPTRETSGARSRFLAVDRYRSGREWDRYEGTPQRELFRTLRERFLARHPGDRGPILDAGAGPGRFTEQLGVAGATPRIALDLSTEMLHELRDRWEAGGPHGAAPDLVVGDAAAPPFRDEAFALVAGIGNLLGFAEAQSDRVLERLERMVRPGGTLLLEVAPGPGERSRYLQRLPPRSVARLLRSGPPLVAGRVAREGFATESVRRPHPGAFERAVVERLLSQLRTAGFRVDETVAVAPALGADPVRIAAAAEDAKAWEHLLDVEERLGRLPERWGVAAAVLVAATRQPPSTLGPKSEG